MVTLHPLRLIRSTITKGLTCCDVNPKHGGCVSKSTLIRVNRVDFIHRTMSSVRKVRSFSLVHNWKETGWVPMLGFRMVGPCLVDERSEHNWLRKFVPEYLCLWRHFLHFECSLKGGTWETKDSNLLLRQWTATKNDNNSVIQMRSVN